MWYVYVDYTMNDAKIPFYVGKGNLDRVKNPLRNSKHSYVSKHFGCDRRIVFETYDEHEALAHEIYLIRALKTFINDNPNSLVSNFTRGGEGISGFTHTEETRKKLRAMFRGKPQPPGVMLQLHQSNIGKKRTFKQRRNISLSAKGRIISLAQREQISKTLTGRSTMRKGISHSNETREKIRIAVRGKQSGCLNGFFGKKHTLESREKMSNAATSRKGSKRGPYKPHVCHINCKCSHARKQRKLVVKT